MRYLAELRMLTFVTEVRTCERGTRERCDTKGKGRQRDINSETRKKSERRSKIDVGDGGAKCARQTGG